MATYDPAWLDKYNQVAASTNAYGIDPSWFVPNVMTPTNGEKLEQAKADYLKANPGARGWSPELMDQMRVYSQPDLFGGLVMTPEGSQAYSDLVTSRNHKDDMGNVATVAGLAAAAFGGAGLMGSGGGAGAAGAGGAGGVGEVGSVLSPAQMGLTGASTLPETLPGLGSLAGGGALGSTMGEIGGVLSPAEMGLTSAGATIPETLPGLGGAMSGIPEASYSHEGMNYGSGGFNPVEQAPVNASTGFLPDWLTNGVGGIADLVGGGGNLAALIGGLAGVSSGGKNVTATTESKTDPRMDQYLYGSGYGDKNSMLGAAQDLYQQNKSGLNPTMQQGLDMQRLALTDPAYGQAFTQMRGLGQGLMSQPIAGNPFTTGAAQLPPPGLLAPQPQPTMQAGGPGGLLGDGDRMKALMARGRGLMG